MRVVADNSSRLPGSIAGMSMGLSPSGGRASKVGIANGDMGTVRARDVPSAPCIAGTTGGAGLGI